MATIIGSNLPNIPWEDRPAGCRDIVWRYSGNPIVERDQIPGSNSIFNSAVVAKDGAFVGIFRSDNTAMEQHLFLGKSDDAIHWDIEPDPLPLYGKDDKQCGVACGYDPRVCWIEDRYYVIPSTALRSAWHIPLILKNFISWKMPSCPSTATASCSLRRSAESS